MRLGWYFGAMAGFLGCFSGLLAPLWAKDASAIRVAVIDTGVDPADPRFAGLICSRHTPWDFVSNKPLSKDPHGHGTHVAGLIKLYAGSANYCFLFFRYYSELNTGADNLKNEISAIEAAIKEGATHVNISGGGSELDEREYRLIKSASHVKFIVAAGNDHQNLDDPDVQYFPASYRLPNVVVVGAMDSKCRVRFYRSNYGNRVNAWEQGENLFSTMPIKYGGEKHWIFAGHMSGTSQATAIHTGKLISDIVSSPCRPQNLMFTQDALLNFVRH
jgi:subtilisin family serine protease